MQAEQYSLQKYVDEITSISLNDIFDGCHIAATILIDIVIIYNQIVYVNSFQFIYRLISDYRNIRIEDLMNLVQTLYTIQITNDFVQQQMLIAILRKLSQTRFLLVRRYSNDEVEISFSTTNETKLVTTLTDVSSYNLAKMEIELVEKKKEISVDENANSFLPKCRLMILNLYDALHLGNYREDSMSAKIIELIINELERIFCLGLHPNSSSDEQIQQALIDKLGLSNEDALTKAIRSIRLLVLMRNAFTRLVFLKAYQEIETMNIAVDSTRSYVKLAELQTGIETVKRCFDNSCEINLFLLEEDKKKFYQGVEDTLREIRYVRERSTNNMGIVLERIRTSLELLTIHRTPNHYELMQSFNLIDTFILRNHFLLNEDEVYLKQYLKPFDCLKPIRDAMIELRPFSLSLNIIEYSRIIITDTNDEFPIDKSCCELVGQFARVSESLEEIETYHDEILQLINNLIELINDFFRKHDVSQFQMLSDDREQLEEFRDNLDVNCAMVETQFIHFYMITFEPMFMKDILAWYNKFDFANSKFSRYASDLYESLRNFKNYVEAIVRTKLSSEQFNLMREMFIRCLEFLASKFGEYKKVPVATDMREFDAAIYYYNCETIIGYEQYIEGALQFPESKKGIVSGCFIKVFLTYAKTFELIFRRDVLKRSADFNLDTSSLSKCTDALLDFSKIFEYFANKIVRIKSHLSQEQFTSMQEMFATCLRFLVSEFNKHNDLFKKVFESKNANLSQIRLQFMNSDYKRKKIIEFEQRVEEVLQFPESERGILSKGFIEPLLLRTGRMVNYITARHLIAHSTELQKAHKSLVYDCDGYIKSPELGAYSLTTETENDFNFANWCSKPNEVNELQMSYENFLQKIDHVCPTESKIDIIARIEKIIGYIEPILIKICMGYPAGAIIGAIIIVPIIYAATGRSLGYISEYLLKLCKQNFIRIACPIFVALLLGCVIYRIVRSRRQKAVIAEIDESLVKLRDNAIKVIDDTERSLFQDEARGCNILQLQAE